MATLTVNTTLGDGSVTNAKLADMAAARVKGRASGAGTGDPTDLTATELREIVKTADGLGSGLDADTLDGHHASEFAVDDHDHDSDYAASGHNHDSTYAASSHNHDSTYAASSHLHTGVYAASSHNHDSTYEPLAHSHDATDVSSGGLTAYRMLNMVQLSGTVTVTVTGGQTIGTFSGLPAAATSLEAYGYAIKTDYLYAGTALFVGNQLVVYAPASGNYYIFLTYITTS